MSGSRHGTSQSLYNYFLLSLLSSKYLHEKTMNCNINMNRKALYRVKWLMTLKKKLQLNVWYFLYKIVYIDWMSCFLEGRYFATLKCRQHEECLELLINKRLLFQTLSSNQNMTQQERSPLPRVQLNGAGSFPKQRLEFHGAPRLTECLEKAALTSTPKLSQQHAVKRGHVILLSNFEDKIARSV